MRSTFLVSYVVPCLGLFFAACGSSKAAGPCDVANPAPECSETCNASGADTCPSGFHCASSGTCFAECSQGGGECGSQNTCTPDGFCVDDGDVPDGACPNINFNASPTTPSIQLVIDRSGSMDEAFGNVSRWEATKTALIGPAGVVTTLQAEIYFGATTYTAGNMCPNLTRVGRALNNQAAIAAMLAANEPDADTPTGESVRAVIQDFQSNAPPAGSPPYIVLATDGIPDLCANGNDEVGGAAESIAAAQAAYNAGIRLFVLGVGPGVTPDHLQKVANAGAGLDVNTGDAPIFVGNNPAELSAAFQSIIGGVISCELDINGQVSESGASAGIVRLNGQILTYGTDWVLADSDTIRLVGAACDELSSTESPQVSAEFPCGVVIE